MLKIIMTARNTTYTRELIESAILWFEIFSESRRYLYMLAKEAEQLFEYLVRSDLLLWTKNKSVS